ncbi:MAG: hypothetical protein ACKO6Q_08035 [Bacteroidota bacterium]
MRILKLFLISLLSFFQLLTAVGLLFPRFAHVSRAIDISGQSKSSVLDRMLQPAFLACWRDSFAPSIAYTKISDSTISWQAASGVRLTWTLHGRDGMITLQGHVQGEFGWLPWQRFRSLLLEPRYGDWLEKQLEQLKRCLDRTQVDSVSP